MKKLGIVKETKNKWERRVPLNPQAVKELIEKSFKVIVQPSETRIYKDEEYEKAGAVLNNDLSQCDFVIGVKEIYNDQLTEGKPHLFFSHVIKGQDYNMPNLQHILDKKVTLFDYEKIEDEKNRRLVFFGKFAGYAGMIDTLHGLGQRLKQEHGIETPFLKIKHSYQYESVQDAIDQISVIGKEIEENSLPTEITPLNIFLLGYGHVAQGCKEIMQALPILEISPDQLAEYSKNYKDNKVYLSVFKEEHLVERKDGAKFDLQDYFNNNAKYKSRLEQYLPRCSVYMNGIYWTPECPVFLPNSYLKNIQDKTQKLIIVGDITCDIGGSVQATVKPTWPDNPVFIYDANTGVDIDGYKGDGVAVMAVDNLPCEFPKEASDTFSKALMPFMESMLLNDYSKSINESTLPNEVRSACIAHHGKLEDNYKYLEEFVKNYKLKYIGVIMAKISTAGNYGKEIRSDCKVTIELTKKGGLKIDLVSKVKEYFGDDIISLANKILVFFEVKNAKITIEDRGALDYVIAARIEAAVKQFIDTDKEFLSPVIDENTNRTKKDRFRRSRLYLPGNTPKLALNAGIHKPDAIILDLEDSVAPAKKAEAAVLVRNTLRSVNFYGAERMVRINQLPMGLNDLSFVVPHNVNLILVPKCESATQIEEVNEEIAKIKKEKKIKYNIWLMPIIESALGVINSYQIACAKNVVALAIGLEDYTADLGTQRTAEGNETFFARSQVVNSAHAAKIQPIDSVFSDVNDMEALKENVLFSKSLGFSGMGCIHPRQIPVIHEKFTPNEKEIEKAQKIIDAYNDAKQKGLGVVALGSKMIDAPVVKKAQQTLDMAKIGGNEQ